MGSVRVCENSDEVLIFAVNENGEGIGEEEYFGTNGDREYGDYDIRLVKLPISVTMRGLRVEG